MTIAYVTYSSIDDAGIIATVNVNGRERNVPIILDLDSPNIKSSICNAIKDDCNANATPVTKVVLPDLYIE